MSFVPAPAVPARVVDITDWAVLGLTCAIAAASLLGAAYCVPWTPRSRAQASTRAFNYLWTTRTLLQLIAALYALSLDLRLEVRSWGWVLRAAQWVGGAAAAWGQMCAWCVRGGLQDTARARKRLA